MNTSSHRYGCHNRPPFVQAYRVGRQWIPTFGAQDCQYTKTDAGRVDLGCDGCKHKQQGAK